MKFIAGLVTLAVGLVHCQIAVPDGALYALRVAGIDELGSTINQLNSELENALEAFKPVNASCEAVVNSNVPKCISCVEQRCKARAESVCRPEEWQRVLGETIGFFKDGIPNFFVGTIPDVFVNKIGGGVIDVSKDVGAFFKDKIGGAFIDVGKTIGSGVVDLGKNIGGGVVDLGKTIAGGVIDVGHKISGGVMTAVNAVKDVGNKIGGFFKGLGGLFGKRSSQIKRDVLLRSKRNEPDCSAFERDASAACATYVNPAYCPVCKIDPNTDCPGYKAAMDRIKNADAARNWMTKITDQSYNILSMNMNPAAMDASGNFNGVQTTVQLFGRQFQFTVRNAINPYVSNVAGPIIARQALDLFKAA